ncbi:Response regulator receiver domain-containing protein [Chryseobacterium piscicola]|mgnify:CR=1 FL=1|jgi:CheY-like chemotaxis protein|nr:response regulator [Chryseobacterium piscicola]SIS89346.1 Response regulator receiver domain-containing protein [Chryseobacterium piscicola]
MKNKILIVDDDPRNIFALKLTLKAKGFEVISATMADEAIQLMKENTDLITVLLDMMMPEIDGYHALAIISETPEIANIPVIAVTAQAMPGDSEKCINAGARDYITKPINVELLLNAIQNIL